MRAKMRTCVCNPAALKAAEELHARSKGYSTSVVMSPAVLLLATHLPVTRVVTGPINQSLILRHWVYSVYVYIYDRSSRVKLSMADCCGLRRRSSPVAV